MSEPRAGGRFVAFIAGVAATLALIGCWALSRQRAGGEPTRAGVLAAELWDPATGTWSDAGTLPAPREQHVMAQLGGGDVVVAGGNWLGQDVRQTLTWNPRTRAFTPAGEIDLYDNAQRAVALGDRVAVFSGRDSSGDAQPGTKGAVFAGGKWTALAPPLASPFRAVAALSGERARVWFDDGEADWSPASGQWTTRPTGPKLFAYVRGGLALASPEWGVALVPVACNAAEKQCAFVDDKIAEQANAIFAAHEPPNWWLAGLVPLDGGRLLLPLEGAAFVWKPARDEATPAAWPEGLDEAYAIAAVAGGRALIMGGHWDVERDLWNSTRAVVYDGKSGAWTATAPLQHGRTHHAALTLHDGRVLVTGGGVMSWTAIGHGPQATAALFALLVLAGLAALWRRRTAGRAIAFAAGVALTLTVAAAVLFVLYAAGSAIKG